MANKIMKTLTIGENTYEVVDEQARADIESLKQNPVIETDDTLTQSGQAADAKVVGDALAEKQPIGDYALKSEIPSIEGLATETYVDTKVAGLVDSAPETLNTLNELSAALGDDPNFAATVATQIGNKVDKTTTVNGKALSSNITLSASDVSALPDTTVIPSIEGLATEDYVDTATQQVVDTLATELTRDQTFIGNVAEQVPIVKVAEEPTFVDSVDDMTDTSKMYVLTTDGMFYSHKTVVIPGETTTTYPNQLVPGAAELNKRYSGSSQSTTTKVGYFVTDYIAVPDFASVTPYNARLNWEVPFGTATDVKIAYFNASKAYLGLNYIAAANTSASSGATTIDLRTQSSGGTAPTVADVAYVRLQLAINASMASLTASDLTNLTITFDAVYETEGTESVTTQTWSSTGIAYNQPADYEDRVISLEANVANNTGNITLLQERMDNLESGEVTTVIPEWWEDEVADTITKIKALQVGRHCITFPFFSDSHQRNGYSGVLIKHVMDECHIPYCFFGGDGIANGYFGDETDTEMRAQDAAFDAATSAIPAWQFCRAIGNHEYYWKVSSSETYYYTSDQVYEVFMRENTLAQSKEFGDSGTYYYVEDKASKVRFIVMDMNTLDDATQITWLQNVALHFDEAGWAVVLIGHQPVTEHYATVIEGAEAARTVLKDYINGSSDIKADVVGWWCGHIHRDRIFEGVAANPGYNGSTDTATDMAEGDPIAETLPWKTVSIISDNTSLGYGGVKHAIDNSDQSHAIDFVTINKSTRTVNLTRLGFGSDRSFTY